MRASGGNRVDLFDTASGASKVSLAVDWTNAVDRWNIRFERQQVGGQDYISLQAMNSSNLYGLPLSVGVLLSSFTSGAGSSEVGFGNNLTGGYYSEWESISITTADGPTTTPVPEPSSMLLLGSGLAGLARGRRRGH